MQDVKSKWVILKTYVSLALHSKRYETRVKHTVGDCNVLLFCAAKDEAGVCRTQRKRVYDEGMVRTGLRYLNK